MGGAIAEGIADGVLTEVQAIRADFWHTNHAPA
jgi:hypothetical protein